ncbi:MAG: amylo-alpha-1,6-glucosidase [Terriglobia bacterium]
MTLRAAATSLRFIAAHGRRGMIVGYAAESLEGWVYPFRIFHDYRLGFRRPGSSAIIPGAATVREVIVNPESVTRVYSGQDFTVRETLFVPLDEGGLVILYQVDSRTPLHIAISFRPDLDLMWPGGIGGQSYSWDAERHAFALLESSGKYSALVGSALAGLHSEPDSYAEPWRADRTLSLELDIPVNSGDRIFPVIASLTAPPYYDAAKTYRALLTGTPALYAEAAQHYQKLVADGVQIETPDRQFNLAYTWARIALDQAYVCNPWLGCGLVAGYGPSRDTRRPQYAWFFGGDALTNTFALEASGDHALARDAIRFIQKYQKKETGEIFHELSQSAGLIDWFKDYPYAYRHTDVSALYLVALRNLYRTSGDLDFVRSSWDSIKAAYGYLVSRVDPSDGLVTIPTGGWGGDETIGQQVVKDIYLESVWGAGAEATEGLANLVGDRDLAGDARGRAEKARASLGDKFWNPQRDFFFYGFSGKGDLLTQELNQPSWGIWMGVFEEEKSERALDNMAHARWEADWGTRSIPADDPLYIGDSYGHGSVWPLGTGEQALAFYSHHRPLEGFPLVRSLVEQSFLNSLGHVPEVLSGDFNRELDVSVPEQIWSSGTVITSLMRGMLGIDPYAPMSELHWTPHLPPDWSGVAIKNLRVGRSTLNLEMTQSDSEIKLSAEAAGPPVAITFAPEIALGSQNVRATVNGRPAAATFRLNEQDEHAEVKFDAEPKTEVVLRYEPGVRPWIPATNAAPGTESRGLRVLSSKLDGHVYSARVEGLARSCSSLFITTPWRVTRVEGGKVSAHQGNRWAFILAPNPELCNGEPPAPEVGHGPYQTWTLRVEFAP